ncbi:MAG: hypothetical protein HY873_00995 [Chloroflexi bacterium]|nr:hypothetical protein [Chloroflexota bacterium]
MGSTRWMALAALLTAGALVFAACDDDKKKDDGSGGDKTPAAEKTTPSDGEKTSAVEPTKDDGDNGGGGDSGELQKLADKFAAATFKAVYEISGDGGDSGLTSGEITISKDGKDKIRFDIKSEVEGEPFEGSFIQTSTESFLCFSGDAAASLGGLLGEDAAEGICVKSAPDDPTNPVGSLVDAFGDIDVGNVEIQDKEDREIAGEDGTCYTVLDNDTNETSTACFNDDGVLLSVESGDSGTFVAKSVEGDVSDADFEPPYPVQEIPGLGQ